MSDLHSRAVAHFGGARPLSRTRRDGETVDSLIQRYVDGGSWDRPDLPAQLAFCLDEAQTSADRSAGATTGFGPDGHAFHQRSAAILRDIQAEVYGRPA